MEFLNIGGGELLVIALLALVLFGPEDIVKMMRTIGKYARQARDMWSQFSSGIQQELQTEEIREALADTQATMAEAQEAVKSLSATVGDIKTTVQTDVSQAQRSVKSQAAESAAALTQKTQTATEATQAVAVPTPESANDGQPPALGIEEPASSPTVAAAEPQEAQPPADQVAEEPPPGTMPYIEGQPALSEASSDGIITDALPDLADDGGLGVLQGADDAAEAVTEEMAPVPATDEEH